MSLNKGKIKVSYSGYKKNSKHKNEPAVVIPSNHITMKGVEFPVVGVDNLGNVQYMMPGGEYSFPGDYVMETPAYQEGGVTDMAPAREVTPQQYYQFLRNTKTGKVKAWGVGYGNENTEKIGQNKEKIYNIYRGANFGGDQMFKGADGQATTFNADMFEGSLNSPQGDYSVVSLTPEQLQLTENKMFLDATTDKRWGNPEDVQKQINKGLKKVMKKYYQVGGNVGPYTELSEKGYMPEKYEGPGPASFPMTPEGQAQEDFYDNYSPNPPLDPNRDRDMQSATYGVDVYEVPMPETDTNAGFDAEGFAQAKQRSDMRNYAFMMNNQDYDMQYEQLIEEGNSPQEAMETLGMARYGGTKYQEGGDVYGEDVSQFQQSGFDVLASNLNAPFIGQEGYTDYAEYIQDKANYNEAQSAKPFATYRPNPFVEGTRDYARKERQNIKDIKQAYKESNKQYKKIKRGQGHAIPVFNDGGNVVMDMISKDFKKKDFKIEPNYKPQEENRDYTKSKNSNFAEFLRSNVINHEMESMYDQFKTLKESLSPFMQTGGTSGVGVAGQGISRDVYQRDMAELAQLIKSGQIDRTTYDREVAKLGQMYDGQGDWQNYQGLNINNNASNISSPTDANNISNTQNITAPKIEMLPDPTAPDAIDYGMPGGTPVIQGGDEELTKMEPIKFDGFQQNTPGTATGELERMEPRSIDQIPNAPKLSEAEGIRPNMSSDKPKKKPGFNGEVFTNKMLAGLSGLNSILESAENARREAELRKQRIHADNVFTTQPDMSGDRGDYHVNTGAFRPDERTPVFHRNYNRMQEGGEYNLTEEEINYILANGGTIEYLD